MNRYYFPLKIGRLGDKFMILSDILRHRQQSDNDSILYLVTNKTHDSFIDGISSLHDITNFFHFKRPNFTISTSFSVDDSLNDLDIIHYLNNKLENFTKIQHEKLEKGKYWPINFIKKEENIFCWMLYTKGSMPEKQITKNDYDKFKYLINREIFYNQELEHYNFSQNVKILSKSKFIFACEGMWTHLSRAMNIPTIAFSRNKDWIREINQQGHFCSSDFEECLFEVRDRCISIMK